MNKIDFLFTNQEATRIYNLIKKVKIIYKNSNYDLDPNTLLKLDSKIFNNISIYPQYNSIKSTIRKDIDRLQDTNIMKKVVVNNNVYDLSKLRLDILKHNSSLNACTQEWTSEKESLLIDADLNLANPCNIKLTPLVNTSLQHVSNNINLNYYIDWLFSSFLLTSEANILINAFYYFDNKKEGKPISDLEQDNYTIWLYRQLVNEYPNCADLLYNKESPRYGRPIYLVDHNIEANMARETFEDLLYVLLNLILAYEIIKYINEINLNDINSEVFWSNISEIINKQFLIYGDDYEFMDNLRRFAINNYLPISDKGY